MHDSSPGLAGSQHWSSDDRDDNADLIGQQGLPPVYLGRLNNFLISVERADNFKTVEYLAIRIAGYLDGVNDAGFELAAANLGPFFERQVDAAMKRVQS